MTTWSDLKAAPRDQSPYVSWWERHEGQQPRNAQVFTSENRITPGQGPFEFDDLSFGGFSRQLRGLRAATAGPIYGINETVPIPGDSLNGAWDAQEDWLQPALACIPALEADTVILGIVDVGIPIGHARLRMDDGRTRILAAWQQTAKFRGQTFLPFGRELDEAEINGLLAAHTHGDHLDEEALNRDAGLVAPARLAGQRDLDRRASHGAHVLDLAGGIDPHGSEDAAALARRLRILAVNLPPQFLHGPAGDYLQFYAAFGLRRIVGLADALWQRDHKNDPQGAFPIALNMSYGMQAGPKDGSGWLDRLMRALANAREPGPGQPATARKPPLRVQMPAGNANLFRCAAKLRLDPGVDAELGWRIQPADQTSNHLEIWTPPFEAADPLDPGDFSVALALPNMPPVTAPPPVAGHAASFCDFADLACFEHWVDLAGLRRRLVFLISVAPTFAPGQRSASLAPAGRWRVLLRGPEGLEVDAFVQSDQSFVLESPIGRRSYFDDPAYRTHWENGRPADSFDYETGQPAPGGGPVTRRGTHNALGARIATIAGYRVADGRPAIYSSTGWSDAEITASYPSEDGFARPGLRAAGSRDGSSVRFSGTSMATALATRDVAFGMLAYDGDWSDEGLFGEDVIKAAATALEGAPPPHYRDVPAPKGGAGRLRRRAEE